MGNHTSNLRQLASNEHLQRLVSPETLPPPHPFWNGLLSFRLKTPRNKSEWKQLEENCEDLLKRLSVNNLKSGNFGSLIDVFLARQAELAPSLETDDSLFVWQTFNALYVIRVCVKFFVERIKEEDVQRQFAVVSDASEQQEGSTDPNKRFERLMDALMAIIVHIPSNPLTYGLLCEAATTLTLLLSTPMFNLRPSHQQTAYRLAMGAPDRARLLAASTLGHFAAQEMAPPAYLNEEGGSLVLGIASGVWSVLTLGYGSGTAAQVEDTSSEEVSAQSNKPLADASLLLLLVLTNHCTDSGTNPYRESLFKCDNSVTLKSAEKNAVSNHVEVASEALDSINQSSVSSPSFSTDFGRLFRSLCATLHRDESTLLLYLLLHRNSAFRSHVLASSDMERVVLPILRTLYRGTQQKQHNSSCSHHIYMSLIVLLILSEDDLFNASVHDVNVKASAVEWYTERSLGQDVSLGGLLILVVIRTIQYNMLKMRDKYLHTNCLAALANMSSQFKNLHPYVSQRIVSMFETLAKKHSRLMNSLQSSGQLEGDEDSALLEARADVDVLEEVLRMVLEIINSCLVSQIKSNSNLIYTLLYKKDIFEPFSAHPGFQDLSQNLQTVISFFNSKLEQVQEKKERTLAVHEVQDIIRQTAMQFPREKLMKFPDLKFKYVEEEQPEEFFVPYVWTLASNKIHWNPVYAKLINQQSN